MPVTAREEGRNLLIDLGESGTVTIPPMPGRHGKEALDMLLGISLGRTREEHGVERERDDTEKLAMMCLGCTGLAGRRRKRQFEKLRASQQELIGQAAILWNVQGGGIDAVNDLLDETDGGYPKALGRVMRSCGLESAYKALMTLLNGADQALSSVADSSASTTTPIGIESTDAS